MLHGLSSRKVFFSRFPCHLQSVQGRFCRPRGKLFVPGMLRRAVPACSRVQRRVQTLPAWEVPSFCEPQVLQLVPSREVCTLVWVEFLLRMREGDLSSSPRAGIVFQVQEGKAPAWCGSCTLPHFCSRYMMHGAWGVARSEIKD
jgi:hypothetical protein